MYRARKEGLDAPDAVLAVQARPRDEPLHACMERTGPCGCFDRRHRPEDAAECSRDGISDDRHPFDALVRQIDCGCQRDRIGNIEPVDPQRGLMRTGAPDAQQAVAPTHHSRQQRERLQDARARRRQALRERRGHRAAEMLHGRTRRRQRGRDHLGGGADASHREDDPIRQEARHPQGIEAFERRLDNVGW